MTDVIERTLLRCGRTVPTWLYKSLLAHVLKRADVLEPCRPYNLRKICGHRYWSGLRGFKTFAGIIMAELVDQELVPFRFASERHEKPLWYWLKP
jgi:hypothetical protein